MDNPVQDITTLPRTSSTPKKVAKWAAVGLFAAGVLLVIDDQVKKFSRKGGKSEDTES